MWDSESWTSCTLIVRSLIFHSSFVVTREEKKKQNSVVGVGVKKTLLHERSIVMHQYDGNTSGVYGAHKRGIIR